MKEFFHKWVTQNLGLKILSLVIAILLWFIFTNLEDPLQTAYYEVPVEVQHLSEYREQNRFIEVEGEQNLDNLVVNVYYRGRTTEIESLKSRNPATFLRAYIDLYEIDPEDRERRKARIDPGRRTAPAGSSQRLQIRPEVQILHAEMPRIRAAARRIQQRSAHQMLLSREGGETEECQNRKRSFFR